MSVLVLSVRIELRLAAVHLFVRSSYGHMLLGTSSAYYLHVLCNAAYQTILIAYRQFGSSNLYAICIGNITVVVLLVQIPSILTPPANRKTIEYINPHGIIHLNKIIYKYICVTGSVNVLGIVVVVWYCSQLLVLMYLFIHTIIMKMLLNPTHVHSILLVTLIKIQFSHSQSAVVSHQRKDALARAASIRP